MADRIVVDGRLHGLLGAVAPLDVTVLLDGETGTGKTAAAAALHAMSPRAAEPFVVINCGGLSGPLVESELFGHVRGAFTGADRDRTGKFERAGAGTLFLDEVDCLTPETQVRLLQVLEERAVEPLGSNRVVRFRGRVVAACNRPLSPLVGAGRFRADLYYRLNVIGIGLAPLRELPDAIPELTAHFLRIYAAKFGRRFTAVSPAAGLALASHSWPGNIRELRNVVERAAAMYDCHSLLAEHLPPELASGGDRGDRSLRARVDREELAVLREVIRRVGNNKGKIAAALGCSRMTVYNKLVKHGLHGRTVRPR